MRRVRQEATGSRKAGLVRSIATVIGYPPAYGGANPAENPGSLIKICEQSLSASLQKMGVELAASGTGGRGYEEPIVEPLPPEHPGVVVLAVNPLERYRKRIRRLKPPTPLNLVGDYSPDQLDKCFVARCNENYGVKMTVDDVRRAFIHYEYALLDVERHLRRQCELTGIQCNICRSDEEEPPNRSKLDEQRRRIYCRTVWTGNRTVESLSTVRKMDSKDGSQSSDDRIVAEMISAYLAQNGFSETALRFAMEYASSSESPLGGSIPDRALEILLTCGLAYFSLESADRANRPHLTDWQTALREASNDTSLYPFWNNLSFSSCHWDEQNGLSSDTEESCSESLIKKEQPDEEGKEECHEQGNKDGQVLVEAEGYEGKEENDDTEDGNSQERKENEQQEEIEDEYLEYDCDTDGEEKYEDRDEDDYEEAHENCTLIKEDHYEEEEEDSYVEKQSDYRV
ncbi:hypothetical protein TTRE_0000864301 [Trichuris trichiura]|uniref:Uncharacterized protein n=1 Tax=Trichuris trichiura TaxID=36087 RepID=A0A077ZKQ6_TRITR|nr:hypothetical protein TTRE_0000864301 [Trichuris trichiura]